MSPTTRGSAATAILLALLLIAIVGGGAWVVATYALPKKDATAAAASGWDVERRREWAGKLLSQGLDDEAIELLCTKPRAGSLSLGDAALLVKGAKPLPSYD